MLLDTASMYFRAFFGVPEILAPDGTTPVNAVRGLLDFISRLVDEYRPTDLVCCWDDDWRPQWRVDLVPTYKAHRVEEEVETAPDVEEVPDPLQVQIPIIRDVLAAYGITVVGAPEAEADDVIGTLATGAGQPVDIVTGDRDLFQLVDDEADVRVLYIARGVGNARAGRQRVGARQVRRRRRAVRRLLHHARRRLRRAARGQGRRGEDRRDPARPPRRHGRHHRRRRGPRLRHGARDRAPRSRPRSTTWPSRPRSSPYAAPSTSTAPASRCRAPPPTPSVSPSWRRGGASTARWSG